MQKSLWKNLAFAACLSVGVFGIACSDTPAAPAARRLDPFSLQPRMDGSYHCTYAEFSNGTQVWDCADYSLETVYVYGWPEGTSPPEDIPSCAIYGTCVVESDPCIDNPDACGFTSYDNGGGEPAANGQDIGYEDGTTDCGDPSGDGYGALYTPDANGYAALYTPDADGYRTLHAPGPNASENFAAIGIGVGGGANWTYLASNIAGAVTEKDCALLQQCLREITETEGQSILQKLFNSDGSTKEWTYTQGGAKGGVEPSRSIANKRGDCTDYTMDAIKNGIAPYSYGTSWPHAWSEKLSTSMFHTLSDAELLNHGYVRVTVPRTGDIVVRGGHAGIFTSMYNGRVMGYADNGRPAVAGDDGSYRDGATGWFNFSPTTDSHGNPVNPEFFRPMVYSDFCDP